MDRTAMSLLRIISLSLLLTVAAPAAPAPAPAATTAWGLEQLMQDMRQHPSGDTTFKETKYLSTLKVPLMVEGVLRYRQPDTLEKEILKPAAERYVIAGDSVEIWRKGRMQHQVSLADYPALQGLTGSIIATMGGDLPSLRQHFEPELSGSRENWILRLKPRDAGLARRLERIEIRGHGVTIRFFEMRQRNGDRSVMQINPPA
jgi:hypothetical protein